MNSIVAEVFKESIMEYLFIDATSMRIKIYTISNASKNYVTEDPISLQFLIPNSN